MLKGVNKSVIEINCTDHGYFERVILFVKPEQSCMSDKRLRGEAEKYIDLISGDLKLQGLDKSISKKAHTLKKNRLRILAVLSAALIGAGVVLMAVLNLL